MNVMIIRSVAASLAAIPMIAFTADISKLDVRLGLWETTTTVADTGGQGLAGMENMPPEANEKMAAAMQKMPPEQRARTEAYMAQMRQHRSGPQVHKFRTCMSAEKMRKDSFFGDKEMRGQCTHTITESDSHATAVTFSCAENGVLNQGQVRFVATSPTAVNGTMDMHVVVHDKPITMHTDMQSTWLGPDCGTVK